MDNLTVLCACVRLHSAPVRPQPVRCLLLDHAVHELVPNLGGLYRVLRKYFCPVIIAYLHHLVYNVVTDADTPIREPNGTHETLDVGSVQGLGEGRRRGVAACLLECLEHKLHRHIRAARIAGRQLSPPLLVGFHEFLVLWRVDRPHVHFRADHANARIANLRELFWESGELALGENDRHVHLEFPDLTHSGRNRDACEPRYQYIGLLHPSDVGSDILGAHGNPLVLNGLPPSFTERCHKTFHKGATSGKVYGHSCRCPVARCLGSVNTPGIPDLIICPKGRPCPVSLCLCLIGHAIGAAQIRCPGSVNIFCYCGRTAAVNRSQEQSYLVCFHYPSRLTDTSGRVTCFVLDKQFCRRAGTLGTELLQSKYGSLSHRYAVNAEHAGQVRYEADSYFLFRSLRSCSKEDNRQYRHKEHARNPTFHFDPPSFSC